ncbi:TetR/AcrR family transcriptional regulator [Alteromonas macleodii]|uniref:HTH tetR-type domain-containing protein n=1 Tax=Alteromonas macleodii TaxID=28108 RepID=A0A6T9Y4H7_ALTMA|nr:TetR/AcrR family transcriptional regulator [Alteromonas macleodii]CAB9495192.1 conserved protein of unknown function [Alteromonas macleodii]
MSTANKKGRPKCQKKRRKILEACASLLLKNGIALTSMDKIAENSGVSKQTVYSHFKNKEELCKATAEHMCSNIQPRSGYIRDESLSPRQVLRSLATFYLNFFQNPDVLSFSKTIIADPQVAKFSADIFYGEIYCRMIDQLEECLANQSCFLLSETQARKFAVAFFNLIKGDFYLRGLMDISFELSDKQRTSHIDTVIDIIIASMGEYSK